MSQFVAELTAYDPSIGGTRTLIYAVKGFSSKPTDTPANTPFDERITQPLDIQRTMFASRATRGRASVAYGQIVLTNPDGALDALNEYGFDGQSLVVRRASSPVAAYPAGYSAVLFGTMQSAEFSTTEIRITVRDRLFEATSAPLQPNRYAGTNVLPAGLEGVPEDLGGKPKPVCCGVVKNIPAPCVNTAKHAYQVNDGAVASVDNVYDRGVALIPGRKWTSIGVIDASTVRMLTFANGIFVAGFFDNKIFTSPDGVTWTLKQTLGNLPVGAAFNGTTWVIATATGTTYTSTNNFGAVTAHASVIAAIGPNDLTYHTIAGLFVCVGTGGIVTSPDGITWTLRSSVSGEVFTEVTYGNGLAVAVGGGSAGVNGIIRTSPDGIAWNATASGVLDSTDGFVSVAYGNGLFVALANRASASSSDAFNWEITQQQLFSLARVTFSGLFVALANSGSVVRTSTDGVKWQDSPAAFGGTVPQHITANGFVMVAIGTLGGGSGPGFYTQLASYSSNADVLDDSLAPMPGEFIAYLAGGYFRLGSTPDGIVTADVTQGATAGDRTAAAIGSLVLQRAGIDPGDIDGSLLTETSVLGYWTMDDGVACSTVMDAAMGTVGGGWPVKADGKFHFIPLAAPSGTADLVITKDDIIKIERITPSDVGAGVPTYQVKVRWGKFYQTMTTDLAGAVTDASRAQFAQQWRDVTATDPAVLTAHPTSQPIVLESLYSNAADAQAGANRELALRQVKRDMYAVAFQLNAETLALDINSVLEIVYPRFALSVISSPSGAVEGGGLFRVLDVAPDAKNDQVTFTVWGGARFANGNTNDRFFMATSTGDYGVAAA